jgi:8-oxo-dGTP pyrophosphatase MutT (NUDIX family)
MVWVPRRKQKDNVRVKANYCINDALMCFRSWPGRLDVTVGGGLGLGDTAMSTIIRECAEEASLDSSFVKNTVRPVGVLPFPNRSPGGWILPGLYYLFDLHLPADGSIRPRTNADDGEVESFELISLDDVLRNIVVGMFKPSSALALVDFLIRHGHITEQSDPRFVDVCMALKPEMTCWPLPWSK